MTTTDDTTGSTSADRDSDRRSEDASHPGTRFASPASAPPPAAPAAASYIGVLCALALIGLGAVGIRDGIAATGVIHGKLWTRSAVEWIDGQAFHGWMFPAGVLALVLGLLCVWVALKPRRKRAVAVAARTSVYLDLSDTAHVAAAAARAVPGVMDARARARRRKHTIRARTTGADPTTQRAAIVDAVTEALAPLAHRPRIRVRTRVGGQK